MLVASPHFEIETMLSIIAGWSHFEIAPVAIYLLTFPGQRQS